MNEFKILPITTNIENNIATFSAFYLQCTETGDAILFETKDKYEAVVFQDKYGNDVVRDKLKKLYKL